MKKVASRSTSSESVKVMSQPSKSSGFQLAAGVDAVAHHVDAAGVDIEADNAELAGKLEGDGQAHVPEADDGQLGLFAE